MIAKFIRKIINEDGQAVVELAITLPILIMILCAIIDFGWFFTNQNTMDYCTRDGARYAIVHSSSVNAIKTYVRDIAPDAIADSLVINVTFSNPANPTLGDVTVEVNGDVNVLTPIAGVFTQGQTMNLSSTCIMKVE